VNLSKRDDKRLVSAAARLDEALALRDISKFMTESSETIRQQGDYAAAATATRINRTALYKMVSANGNPAASTLISLLAHLGLRLSVQPLDDAGGPSAVRFSADTGEITQFDSGRD
jgi:DNA-binding phage protein